MFTLFKDFIEICNVEINKDNFVYKYIDLNSTFIIIENNDSELFFKN